ncbi:hypothetical protein ABG768_001142 [Culter alburnus]|uniref:Ig-like domain-containing protein n=1 Tax=Culter alburnus TaxID=194366 RepID=A0AAW2B877_CULAL
MVSSLIKSLPLIVVIMTAGVDGQQDWGVNYSPSYVCALKGSTVKISCTLTYPYGYLIRTVFWTKTAGESPDLCSDPEKRGGIQCLSEDKDTSSITLSDVTEADKHVYYCRFTTNIDGGNWTGIPGVQLDVTAVDGLQDLGVNYSPSYVCALKGSTVKISCTLKYPPGHVIRTVFWTKPAITDGELPDLRNDQRKRGRVQYHSEDKDTHSITLTNVTEADKHVYYCRFTTNNADGKWTGIPGVQLDVTDLQVETQQRVKEGDSVTLTCKSSCSLTEQTTFIWFRNTQRFTEGIEKENQLHLQSVSSSDEGNYRCAVRGNNDHLISPDVHLNVEWVDGQQDWGVNYSPSYVCALKGSNVKISCTLKYPHGHVIRTAFWTKHVVTDGESPDLCSDPEKRGGIQCLNEDKDTSSITLTKVTEADKHVYYCRFTTNIEGNWTGIPGVQLDITVKTNLQVETQQRVKEGDSVTLTCKSSCSLTEQTTFIWYRNRERFTEGIVKENQLHLQSVSSSDAGNYRCAVRGNDHLLSPPVYLKVDWVDGQQDWGVNYSPSYVCALKGSTVKISCTLKYHPGHVIRTVFWTKPTITDGELSDLRNDQRKRGRVQYHSEDKNTHSITLMNVTEADKHVYYCRFTTNIDGGKWTGIPGVQLDVTDLQVETQQRVKEGDSVTLTCKSSCSLTEQTTFIWFRNTQRFTEGIVKENQLHLQSVSRSDEGNYQCEIRGNNDHLISPAVYLKVEWVQRAALHTVSGIVAGCGGLIFIIIIIIVFIK